MPASNNPFYVAPPDVMQSLMSFDQSYNSARKDADARAIKQARQDAARMFAGGDQQGAMARIMAVDPHSAALLGHIYQQSPAGITETETAKAKVAAEYAPKTFDFTDDQGVKHTVERTPGGGLRVPPVEGLATGTGNAGNPFAAPGKQSTEETMAGGYARRMFNAEGIIRPLEKIGTSSFEKGVSKLPYGIGNYLSSEDAKKYDQAKRNFVSGVLRRESGKLISQKEYEDADLQYFPQPNDPQSVIDQKRQARADAIREVAGGAGRTFKSPYTFGANNEMIPAGGQGPASVAAPGAAPAKDPIGKARAAIAAGADKTAVAKRLSDAGIDPSGL